jgi:hypothetical protein
MTDDAHIAHILFPNDAPKSQQAPDWFKAGHAAAEQRLAGQQHGGAAAKVQAVGNGGNPASPAGSADETKPDDASVLFADKAASFDAQAVTEIFDGFANSAISDNDGGERARAIGAAKDGLIADAKAHGMDATELSEAMAVVKERQADSIVEPTPEQAEQRMTEALDVCRDEGITDADLGLARRFIADLEVVSPGTIATLERSGAGNDLRLIRAAIKEARRRGYRG